MAWDTVSFIRAFMHGTLGRKRVHGTYRVLVGDHCKVLVRASTRYGVPDGNTLIGINLSDEEQQCMFFHWFNTNCFTYRMNKDLDVYNAPKIPADVLDDDDGNILASGIVEANDTKVLIELGDKPYLLHKKVDDNGKQVVYDAESGGGIPKFATADKLRVRVATIAEAEEQVKDPVGLEQLLSGWWIDKMPVDFKPPALLAEYVDTLHHPLDPLDFDFTIDDCGVTSTSHDGNTFRCLTPRSELIEGTPDARAREWLDAKALWDKAVEKLVARTPLEYEGLTTKSERYSYGGSSIQRTGQIVRAHDGVYLLGEFRTTAEWNETQTLTRWHKIHSTVNRIKLG